MQKISMKLIQALQKRVLQRTRSYDTEVPEQLRVTDEGKEEALEISRKQGQVEELTRKMAEKLDKDGGSGGGR